MPVLADSLAFRHVTDTFRSHNVRQVTDLPAFRQVTGTFRSHNVRQVTDLPAFRQVTGTFRSHNVRQVTVLPAYRQVTGTFRSNDVRQVTVLPAFRQVTGALRSNNVRQVAGCIEQGRLQVTHCTLDHVPGASRGQLQDVKGWRGWSTWLGSDKYQIRGTGWYRPDRTDTCQTEQELDGWAEGTDKCHFR